MKTLTFLVLVFLSHSILAQPVLSTAITPSIGQTESYFIHDTTGIMPGPSGANQTWNFNLNAGLPESFTYISSAGTPYVSSFPNAGTAAFFSGFYIYFETLPGYFDYYGFSDGTNQMIYSDPETYLVGPFSYQNLSQDICSATFSYSGGVTGTRTGTTDKYYDAYGTLIINGITHNNVARIFMEQNFTDSSNIASNFSHIENFIWFDGNSMSKLFEISVTYNANNVITSKTVKSYSVSTNLAEIVPSEAFRISCNPDSPGKYNLLFKATKSKKLNMEIYSITGTLIQKKNLEVLPGQNNIEFSMDNYSNGLYFLNLSDENFQVTNTGKFLLHR